MVHMKDTEKLFLSFFFWFFNNILSIGVIFKFWFTWLCQQFAAMFLFFSKEQDVCSKLLIATMNSTKLGWAFIIQFLHRMNHNQALHRRLFQYVIHWYKKQHDRGKENGKDRKAVVTNEYICWVQEYFTQNKRASLQKTAYNS